MTKSLITVAARFISMFSGQNCGNVWNIINKQYIACENIGVGSMCMDAICVTHSSFYNLTKNSNHLLLFHGHMISSAK